MEPRAGGSRGCAGRWHEGLCASAALQHGTPTPAEAACPSKKTEPETEVPGQEQDRGNSRETAAVPLVPGRDSAQSPPGNAPAAAEPTRGAGVAAPPSRAAAPHAPLSSRAVPRRSPTLSLFPERRCPQRHGMRWPFPSPACARRCWGLGNLPWLSAELAGPPRVKRRPFPTGCSQRKLRLRLSPCPLPSASRAGLGSGT